MPAEHHDLVLLVTAWNLADRVIGCSPFRILFVLNVDFQGHRRAVTHDA